MIGFPEAYAQMAAVDALDKRISALDAMELLQRADLADETEGVCELKAFQAFMRTVKPKQVHSFCALPAAYEGCAADDKFDATLARADMEALQQAYVATVLDDEYQATLANADLSALRRRVDAAEFALERAMIDDLPKAYAATAADDELEVRLASADMIDVQSRVDAADMESSAWSVKQQKTIDEWARQVSECSTTVPDGFARQVSLPEF